VYSSGTGSDLPPDAEGSPVPDDASLDDFLPADEGDEPADDGEPDDDPEDATTDGRESAAQAEGEEGRTGEREEGRTGEREEGRTGEREEGRTGEDEVTPAPAAVDPAVSTYAWSPDGADCAACGAVVERRWRDGDELVCSDCKEW